MENDQETERIQKKNLLGMAIWRPENIGRLLFVTCSFQKEDANGSELYLALTNSLIRLLYIKS